MMSLSLAIDVTRINVRLLILHSKVNPRPPGRQVYFVRRSKTKIKYYFVRVIFITPQDYNIIRRSNIHGVVLFEAFPRLVSLI